MLIVNYIHKLKCLSNLQLISCSKKTSILINYIVFFKMLLSYCKSISWDKFNFKYNLLCFNYLCVFFVFFSYFSLVLFYASIKLFKSCSAVIPPSANLILERDIVVRPNCFRISIIRFSVSCNTLHV